MKYKQQPVGSESPLYGEAYRRCQALEGWDAMPEEQKVAELDSAIKQHQEEMGKEYVPIPPLNDEAYLIYIRQVLHDFEKESDE